jgi:hypothetical protein
VLGFSLLVDKNEKKPFFFGASVAAGVVTAVKVSAL